MPRRAAGYGRARPPRRVRDAGRCSSRETKACSMRVSHVRTCFGQRRRARTVLDVARLRRARLGDAGGRARARRPRTSTRTTSRYHVYLVEGARERGATHVAARDVRSRIDRARAFTVLDASVAHAGCSLDALVAREIARAVLYRVAPATAEGVARAQTTYLAQLIVPCAIGPRGRTPRRRSSRDPSARCAIRASSETGTSAEEDARRRQRPAARSSRARRSSGARIDWAYGRAPAIDRDGIVGALADDDRRAAPSAGTTSRTRSTCSA